MSVRAYQTTYYGDFTALRLRKNKANRRPSAGSPKLEILNAKQYKWAPNDKALFKKQSQFA